MGGDRALLDVAGAEDAAPGVRAAVVENAQVVEHVGAVRRAQGLALARAREEEGDSSISSSNPPWGASTKRTTACTVREGDSRGGDDRDGGARARGRLAPRNGAREPRDGRTRRACEWSCARTRSCTDGAPAEEGAKTTAKRSTRVVRKRRASSDPAAASHSSRAAFDESRKNLSRLALADSASDETRARRGVIFPAPPLVLLILLGRLRAREAHTATRTPASPPPTMPWSERAELVTRPGWHPSLDPPHAAGPPFAMGPAIHTCGAEDAPRSRSPGRRRCLLCLDADFCASCARLHDHAAFIELHHPVHEEWGQTFALLTALGPRRRGRLPARRRRRRTPRRLPLLPPENGSASPARRRGCHAPPRRCTNASARSSSPARRASRADAIGLPINYEATTPPPPPRAPAPKPPPPPAPSRHAARRRRARRRRVRVELARRRRRRRRHAALRRATLADAARAETSSTRRTSSSCFTPTATAAGPAAAVRAVRRHGGGRPRRVPIPRGPRRVFGQPPNRPAPPRRASHGRADAPGVGETTGPTT